MHYQLIVHLFCKELYHFTNKSKSRCLYLSHHSFVSKALLFSSIDPSIDMRYNRVQVYPRGSDYVRNKIDSRIPRYNKLIMPTFVALKELGGSGTNDEILNQVIKDLKADHFYGQLILHLSPLLNSPKIHFIHL